MLRKSNRNRHGPGERGVGRMKEMGDMVIVKDTFEDSLIYYMYVYL